MYEFIKVFFFFLCWVFSLNFFFLFTVGVFWFIVCLLIQNCWFYFEYCKQFLLPRFIIKWKSNSKFILFSLPPLVIGEKGGLEESLLYDYFTNFTWTSGNTEYFYFALGILILAYICSISKNIILVLFCLVIIFILTCGLLFCLNIRFLSLIYIMVYVGAIIVLFLFAIMLLNFREESISFWGKSAPTIISLILFPFLFTKAVPVCWEFTLNSFSPVYRVDYIYMINFVVDDIYSLRELYTTYSLLLIILAVMLTMVMVGSVGLCLHFKSVYLKKF